MGIGGLKRAFQNLVTMMKGRATERDQESLEKDAVDAALFHPLKMPLDGFQFP